MCVGALGIGDGVQKGQEEEGSAGGALSCQARPLEVGSLQDRGWHLQATAAGGSVLFRNCPPFSSA